MVLKTMPGICGCQRRRTLHRKQAPSRVRHRAALLLSPAKDNFTLQKGNKTGRMFIIVSTVSATATGSRHLTGKRPLCMNVVSILGMPSVKRTVIDRSTGSRGQLLGLGKRFKIYMLFRGGPSYPGWALRIKKRFCLFSVVRCAISPERATDVPCDVATIPNLVPAVHR